MTIMGFWDARCPKCHCRIGWSGAFADKPPCRRCGAREEQAALDAMQRQGDEYDAKHQADEKAEHERVAAALEVEGTPERQAFLKGVADRQRLQPEGQKLISMPVYMKASDECGYRRKYGRYKDRQEQSLYECWKAGFNGNERTAL